MIIACIVFVSLFAVLMLAGAINFADHNGEEEGICKYDQNEE